MKIRYRTKNRLFRKPLLILQVGVEHKVGQYCSADGDMLPPPSWNENATYVEWRDATVEDLQILEER